MRSQHILQRMSSVESVSRELDGLVLKASDVVDAILALHTTLQDHIRNVSIASQWLFDDSNVVCSFICNNSTGPFRAGSGSVCSRSQPDQPATLR